MKKKNYKMDVTGKFVPLQMFNLLGKQNLNEINFGDHKELNLSILFTDIRDFTSISEKLKPIDSFNLVNSFFTRMDQEITRYNGIIDKFLGDGIMAVFPTKADTALKCSIEMISQLKNLNKYSDKPLKAGIGLNTGLCMLGVVGGINKMEVTVISDVVNLAARLEKLNKFYKTNILISDDTLYNLENDSLFHIRFIDRVAVTGKSQIKSIYEVYDNDDFYLKSLKDKHKILYEEAIANFYFKNFDLAKKKFIEYLKIFPDDEIAKIYIARCNDFFNSGIFYSDESLNEQIVWSKDFEVGIPEIDEQHYNLITNTQKLINTFNDSDCYEEIQRIVNFLDNYVSEHFSTEEKLLKECNYPFLEHQIYQHNNFTRGFNRLKKEISDITNSNIYMMFKIRTLLLDWIVNHTLREDSHYAKFLNL